MRNDNHTNNDKTWKNTSKRPKEIGKLNFMQATYKRVKNWFLARKLEIFLLRRLAANSCVDGKTTIEKTTEALVSRVLNLARRLGCCYFSVLLLLVVVLLLRYILAWRSFARSFIRSFRSVCDLISRSYFGWHVAVLWWHIAHDRDSNKPKYIKYDCCMMLSQRMS